MTPTPYTNIDSLIARSTRYITETWGPQRGYNLASPGLPVLAWQNTAYAQELSVRGAAMAAFTLATPIFLGTYNYNAPVASQQRDAAARLLAAVLRQHESAPYPGGNFQRWGTSWQSPLWASWAGLAALVGWHDLIPDQTHRKNVYAMLETEANYVLGFPVEWWRLEGGAPGFKHDDAGNPTNVLRTEDSAAEENTWRAQVLWIASAFMPTHPNAPAWQQKAEYLNQASFAHRTDGYDGWNVDDLYLVHNHAGIHPDYQTNVAMNAFGWVVNGLVGRVTPRYTLHNFQKVWDALQVSSMDANGTKAYSPASPAFVQFPTGTQDWGWRRPHAYAVFDDLASMLYPVLETSYAPIAPEFWYAWHLADAGNMQYRATSATHPFGAFVDSASNPKEATYPEEEVYASSQLCYLRLTQHVNVDGRGTGLLV